MRWGAHLILLDVGAYARQVPQSSLAALSTSEVATEESDIGGYRDVCAPPRCHSALL